MRIVAVVLGLLGLFGGCTPADEAPVYRRTFPALGTLVAIEIRGTDAIRARAASDRVEALFARIQADWHGSGPGELGRVNAALANGEAVHTTPEVAALVARGLHYRELSDGLYDPVIGDLVALWGFDDERNSPAAPPDEAAITAWRTNARPRVAVTVAGQTIRAPVAVRIDLGGMAKGTALARAIDLLQEAGIENALVDAGGDLQVIGRHDGRNWRIGIRNPDGKGIIAAVELRPGEAIVTSGDYARYFDYAGQRYHHLMDPRTGRPTRASASVTVIDADPERADAAATALMVAGPSRVDEMARRMGIASALLVGTDGTVTMTAAMQQRLRETGS